MRTDKKLTKSDMLDPDVRFLLANERTFLAWLRTALAVMAGGIALTQLGHDSTAQTTIGVTAIILSGFMSVVGYVRFKAADRAIRRGELPIVGNEPIIQAGGVAMIAMTLAVTRIFGIW